MPFNGICPLQFVMVPAPLCASHLPYFAHLYYLLGPCRHFRCSFWRKRAETVRSHMLPVCCIWLASPGSCRPMPSGQARRGCFPRVFPASREGCIERGMVGGVMERGREGGRNCCSPTDLRAGLLCSSSIPLLLRQGVPAAPNCPQHF